MPRVLPVLVGVVLAITVTGVTGGLAMVAAPAVVAGPVAPPDIATPEVEPQPTPVPPPTLAPTPTPAPPTPAPTPWARGPIVALGNSVTYGYGAGVTFSPWGPPPAHSYPWDMARDLGIPVVNAGVSGTTAAGLTDPTADSAPRPASLDLSALLARHPSLVIVFYGGNEAVRGWPIATTVADYRRLLDRIAAAHVPILLVGEHVDCSVDPCWTGPHPATQPYTAAWDAALTSLAAEYHAGLVLDVLHGLAAGEMTDWEHPNAAGYQVIAGRIEAAVRALLS